MNDWTIPRTVWLALVFCVLSFLAAAEEFPLAVQACLQQRVEVEKRNVGIVVGLVPSPGAFLHRPASVVHALACRCLAVLCCLAS